jgi:hypothetical protein
MPDADLIYLLALLAGVLYVAGFVRPELFKEQESNGNSEKTDGR